MMVGPRKKAVFEAVLNLRVSDLRENSGSETST